VKKSGAINNAKNIPFYNPLFLMEKILKLCYITSFFLQIATHNSGSDLK